MLVVYHLQNKSGNFGWNVNEKTNLVFPNGKFREKRDFLKRGPKFLNGISERKLCVPFALSDQFQAFRIGLLGTVNGTANPVWKFPFGF